MEQTYSLETGTKKDEADTKESFKKQQKDVTVNKLNGIPLTDKEKSALHSWQNGSYSVGVENVACTGTEDEKVSPPPSYMESVITVDKEAEAEEEGDPWDVVAPQDTGKPWKGKHL